MDPNTRIGFVGMGKMAQALCQGFISKGLVQPANIIASKATKSGLQEGLLKDFLDKGVRIGLDNELVVQTSDIVFLSVKPQILPSALPQIAHLFNQDKLIISVVAGLTIPTIQKLLGGGEYRIVRAMPNTPVEICEGATLYTIGEHVRAGDAGIVKQLFSAVGMCKEVTPAQFPVAVNGIGPAFVFMMIEALADGAVLMGLPRQVALEMVAQTVKGAAALQLETGLHPGELKDRVCSPGGTTIRGVQALEEGGVRAAFIKAVQASTERGLEIGKQQK